MNLLAVLAVWCVAIVPVFCQSTSLPNYRVLSCITPDSNLLFANPAGGNQSFSGFIWDFLTALGNVANFTFTMSLQPDGIYGQLQDGKWNGMIGQLIAGNTDIIAADLTISAARLGVIDFTIPYDAYELVTVTKTGASLDGIKYAILNDSDMYSMQRYVDTQEQTIWSNIQANAPKSILNLNKEGINLVKQGGWAFIAEDVEVRNDVNDPTNQLSVVGRPLMKGYYGFAVQQGSPIGRQLSIGIATLEERGDLQRLLAKRGFDPME